MEQEHPFLPEDLVNALLLRQLGVSSEVPVDENTADQHKKILAVLEDAHVGVEGLRDKSASQVEQLLDDNFSRLRDLLGPINPAFFRAQMDFLGWDETVSFGTALNRLQIAVQDEKQLLAQLTVDPQFSVEAPSDDAYITRIFNSYAAAQTTHDLPPVEEFDLSTEGLALLLKSKVLTADVLSRLVKIQSMFPSPVLLSRPEPLNRRVRTLHSLYRAIELGVFDTELFPSFEILLETNDEISTLEEAREAFIDCLSPLLSVTAEGKDVASAHDLLMVLGKLGAVTFRAKQLEQDALEVHEELEDAFFADTPPRVSDEAKIVGITLPNLLLRLRQNDKQDAHEIHRLRDDIDQRPMEKIKHLLRVIGRLDDKDQGSVA